MNPCMTARAKSENRFATGWLPMHPARTAPITNAMSIASCILRGTNRYAASGPCVDAAFNNAMRPSIANSNGYVARVMRTRKPKATA